MDYSEIIARLEAKVDEWIPKCSSNVKRVGKVWSCGDIYGAEGSSCNSFFANQAGCTMFRDHSNGVSVNLIQFYANCHNVTHRNAIKVAREFLGIIYAKPISKTPKPSIDYQAKAKFRGLPGTQYLINERGLNEMLCKEYKVGGIHRDNLPCPDRLKHSYASEDFWITSFRTPDNDLVMYKWTGLERKSGKKEIGTTVPQYSTLWGWWLVNDNTTEILICEGEIDAMSAADMRFGCPCLSLPSGVNNLGWIENDYDRLQDFEKIYICLDSDQAGKSAAKEIAERLGNHRVYVVTLPDGYKDVNEILVRGPDKIRKTFPELKESASRMTPEAIQEVGDIVGEAIERRKERDSMMERRDFCLDIDFIQLPGELTALQGYVASGKSDFSYQMVVNDLHNDHKVLCVSFEIPSSDMMEAMAQNWKGKGCGPEFLQEFADWSAGKLWFIGDEHSDISFDELCANVEYCVKRFGVTRVLIDSFHFLAGKKEYELQDKIFTTLKRLAAKLKTVHITLIAHSRYGEQGQSRPPEIDSVEGSKGTIKVAQNIIAIWRNRPKEWARENGDTKKDNEPDAKLLIQKQRNGFRKEFQVQLAYDWQSRKFYKHHGPALVHYKDTNQTFVSKSVVDEKDPF